MIDLQLFIINLLCIIGASVISYALLTYFGISDKHRTAIAIIVACAIVIVIYMWINVPKMACTVCAITRPKFTEGMMNYNDDIPKFESEQDGLIIPENIHGTIRTDINLDKFLKYGYMSDQLKEAMMYQKLYGGTNPPPSVTATTQIVGPFSDVVIPVDPVLVVTKVPTLSEIQPKPAELVPEAVPEKIEVAEEFTPETSTKVILFFSPHCGYCKDFMKPNGIWQRVKQDISTTVDIVEINSDINPQMCRDFNISYFPCLLKIKDNNIYEFNNIRTIENIEAFCLN